MPADSLRAALYPKTEFRRPCSRQLEENIANFFWRWKVALLGHRQFANVSCWPILLKNSPVETVKAH